MCFAWVAKTESVERDHLVRGKAVMQFAHPHIFRINFRFSQGSACRMLCHSETHEIDGRAVEKIGSVGGEMLAYYFYGLRTEVWTSVEEVFGDDDGRGAAVGRGAALEFGEG